MKKMMFAAVAALAMVGAANAAKSYGISSASAVAPYELDTTPGEEHSGWYSCYAMKQEDAQAAMGCVGTTVTYSDMATWLGKNFTANKASVIENAERIPYTDYSNSQYQFGDFSGAPGSGLKSAIGVFFYDDGGNLAYNVEPNLYSSWLAFNDESGSGWQAASVPEPTSGLLLLLGVAGLALKRRRA